MARPQLRTEQRNDSSEGGVAKVCKNIPTWEGHSVVRVQIQNFKDELDRMLKEQC